MDPHKVDRYHLERLGAVLREFYLRSHRLVDRKMTEKGASFAKARILSMINAQGAVRSIDLASAFGYAPRTVTEAIDSLERDGLVRRDPDPDDRRAKRISLTEAGGGAIESSEALRLELVESLYGTLTHDECEEMVRVIGKLVDRLVEIGG